MAYLLASKKENKMFEPENWKANKGKTPAFADVCPSWIALLQDFRAIDWATEYKYPTVMHDQMKGLLAKGKSFAPIKTLTSRKPKFESLRQFA